MAITNINGGIPTSKGITYSVITDSSSDWPSVGNDVYFFDKDTDLPYYKNTSGTVVSIFEEGGGGGTTNLSIGSKTSTTLDIVSSDGTDATVPAVTTSEAGLSSAADKTKLDGIDVSAITANTAKTGITSGQASAITANTAKDGITSGQASAITANTAKTGISSGQASEITANTAKTGITSGQASAITANTAKDGVTSGQASAITANTAKTGITSGQASAITANTAKNTNITTNLSEGTTTNTSVDVNSSDGTNATIAAASTSRAGVMTKAKFDEVVANTAKDGITSGQASAITANTAKTGITSGQASAITANTAKTGITSGQASAITANTAKTGITSGQASAITANTAKTGITSAQTTKLDGIEASADVTDTANVTSAGALMDSEVTNLAQVKAFDSSDYATSAQGTLATNALPKSGGAMTGAITTNSTFDGRDVATDGTKLDGIEASATIDQTDAEIETAYNNQVAVATQAEAEAGTLTDVKRFTPQRVKQAIDALSGGGSGNAITLSVQKDSSGTINKGQVVILSDYDVGADLTTVELADNSAASTMPGIGIATSSIAQATTGTVIIFGKATGLDTSSLSLGDVYVSTSGNLTNAKPTGTSIVQRIGKVTRVSSTVGEIIVFGGGMDNVNSSVADYVRASIVSGGLAASYASADQVVPMTVQSENSNTDKFTITSNGVRINQAGRYRVNCGTTVTSSGTQRANPIMKITVNNNIAQDANNQDYQTSEHYARNAGSAAASTSSLDIVLDLAANDIVRIILAEGGVSGNSNVTINSTGTFLELAEMIAGQTNLGDGVGTKVLVQGRMDTTQGFTTAAERIDYVDNSTLGFDINGEWDNTTHRFTVAASGAGVYQFTNQVFVDNGNGWIQLFCKKNGVTGRITGTDLHTSWDTPIGTTNIELAVGDYVEFWLDSTQSFSMNASWYALNNFQITKIGDSVTIYNAPAEPRIVSVASTATLSISSSITDQSIITAQSQALTIAAPTGTPVEGQKLIIRLKDNGTGRALTWNAIYRALGNTIPTTTVANKLTYVGLIYNITDTKWDVVAVSQEA